MRGHILIVDDEEQLRKLLTRILLLEGFSVAEAGNLKAAIESLERKETDLVLCDVRLPDGNGVEFVRKVKSRFPSTEIILLTAYGKIPDGVLAIKNGAFDYLIKGDDNDRIIPLVHQAMELALANRDSAVRISEKAASDFGSILGESASLRQTVAMAAKIAETESAVLLLGETGTGKEVFANAIHAASRRRAKPFVAINCSSFNRDLLEAELFGYRAGAYTGAVKDKKGLIELAAGGTLFLDEIGEMSIELQAKLLRVLDNGEYIKLGDTRVSRAEVRLIAATNRDLDQMVEGGQFRSDLFYRLNAFVIKLPPLRERPEDIPVLASYFIRRFVEKENRKLLQLSGESLLLLQRHPWKGNVRELKNVIERAVILAEGNEILPEHLPFEIQKQDSKSQPALSLASVEKDHIKKILAHTGGNKTRAARLMEIGLATLYRKMEEYGIS